MRDFKKTVRENSKLFVTCTYIALVIALTQIISSQVQKYYIDNQNAVSAFFMLIFLVLLYGFFILILVKTSTTFRGFLLRMFGVEVGRKSLTQAKQTTNNVITEIDDVSPNSQEIAKSKLAQSIKLLAKIIIDGTKEIKDIQAQLESSLIGLVEIGAGITEVHNNWADSMIVDRIDSKVFATKKLDFEGMKEIMSRVILSHTILENLNFIRFCVNDYKLTCERFQFNEGIRRADALIKMTSLQVDFIEAEIKELKAQIENVNLYYQNFMVVKSTRIAYLSLGIASLAFLLTTLQIVLQYFHFI